jgi:hypothetical protein
MELDMNILHFDRRHHPVTIAQSNPSFAHIASRQLARGPVPPRRLCASWVRDAVSGGLRCSWRLDASSVAAEEADLPEPSPSKAALRCRGLLAA